LGYILGYFFKSIWSPWTRLFKLLNSSLSAHQLIKTGGVVSKEGWGEAKHLRRGKNNNGIFMARPRIYLFIPALLVDRVARLFSFLSLFKKLPPYTPAGFDLTTHNSASGYDTTRPRRQGKPDQIVFFWQCFRKWKK
jgi:hypothetical protein